ncbi:MAG: hypothetical protein U0791_14685 [Gemmataceae bacterium]
MQTLFPYIGESVLRAIIESNPRSVLTVFRPDGGEAVEVLQQVRLVFPKAGISFDGFQNLDLGLLVNGAELVPIEVKLGRKGLHRSNINKLLDAKSTVPGHRSEKRVAGNMLAVLNRYFDDKLRDEIGEDRLQADVNGRHIPVSDDWGVIARASVLDSWKRNPPRFNGKERGLSLEDICGRFGRDNFNKLAAEMLKSQDYFKDWIDQGV